MKRYEREPSLIRQIASYIEGGASTSDAARACGVGRTTIYRWIAEDEDIHDEIERATSVAQQRLVRSIYEASNTDWRAAAWLLARRWPDEFGKRI